MKKNVLLSILLLLFTNSLLLSQTNYNWTKTNGPYTSIREILFNSKGELIVFSALRDIDNNYLKSVIYKSNDKGDSWSMKEININDTIIEHFFIAPNDDFYVTCRYKSTLYKSSDGGDSWTKLFEQKDSLDLYIKYISPDGDIYISLYNFHNSNSNYFKSQDNGNTWLKLDSNWNWKNYSKLIFGTNNKMLGLNYNSNTGIYNVFISLDGGISWNKIH